MTKTTLPTDNFSRFAISIFQINSLLLRSGNKITKPLGQTSARWQVLGVAAHEPQTVAGIARSTGHARQSVQRIADVLTKDGLTVYVSNPADKRAQILHATPKGTHILNEIYERNQLWTKEFIKNIDDQQLIQLIEGLEMMQRALQADQTN